MGSKSINVQVVRASSFEQQQQEATKRPDEIVSITLARRAKKTVSWADDVQDSESCCHCAGVARKENKKSERSRPWMGSPSRKYFKALVTHLLP